MTRRDDGREVKFTFKPRDVIDVTLRRCDDCMELKLQLINNHSNMIKLNRPNE